jgi:hypothetical protein
MLAHGNTNYSKGLGPQQRAWCSNLDQRITNGGDEVAEVTQILSYDQTCEVAEILSYDRSNARVRFP